MIAIPFCDMCGNKLPKSDSKFCPKCGATVGVKARPQQAAPQAIPQGEAGAVKAALPNTAGNVLGVLVGLAIAGIIIFAVLGYIGSSAIPTGSGYDGGSPGVTQTCDDKAGFVTCGYCNLNSASGNSHAGKCRYCPSGTTCSGEICGEMTCKSSSQPSGGASATPASSATPAPSAAPTPGNGGNGGNGGGGYITEFPIDSRTGCPVQGSTSGRGSVNLQCSQMIPAGRCSIQSCTCYYSDAGGDTARAYYRTSDGAYFPCSGDGRTSINCVPAAQAAANHCVPT